MITAIKRWHVCSVPVQVALHNKTSPSRQQRDIFIKLDYPILLAVLAHRPPRHHTISSDDCRLLIINWQRLSVLGRHNKLYVSNGQRFHFLNKFFSLTVWRIYIYYEKLAFRLNQRGWLRLIWPAALAAAVRFTVFLRNYMCFPHFPFLVWSKWRLIQARLPQPFSLLSYS